MKPFIVLVIIIALMTNLESTTATVLNPIPTPVLTVTPNVQVPAKKLNAVPKRALVYLPPSSIEDTIVVDDDVVLARNRNRLDIVHEKEQELSDYVKIRLALARMKALQAYSIASLSK
jgi:hypothetical protein